ncbi:MAG: phasin family protein [Rhizomicrobium sp.]
MAKATKGRRRKSAPVPAGKPKREMPKSGPMEAAAPSHKIADKDSVHAKDAVNAKAATTEATDLSQYACITAGRGAANFSLKAIEIARTNTNTAIDYAHELMGVKSLSEFVGLSNAHARKQFEAMIAQINALTDLAKKVTTEFAEPLKAGGTGTLNSRKEKRQKPGEDDISEMTPQEEVLLLHALE